ncbi:hypothetical protein D046_4307 [Vibrio parahaemolyticus V-223/04]|nr:hypothetical protein D022_1944 [Vibrio parahaemolyticus 12310]EVU15556.1 hypothetical protein D046_4307 [Vibrio parahaemolyticus V-223/04]
MYRNRYKKICSNLVEGTRLPTKYEEVVINLLIKNKNRYISAVYI